MTFLAAVVAATIAVMAYSHLEKKNSKIIAAESQQKMVYTNLPEQVYEQTMDFTFAAERAVHAVVHVKTKSLRSSNYNPFYDFWFGPGRNMQPSPALGFGSGVIISDDGYIVTNNHVIDNSDEIEVVLNDRRSFNAKVIGTDKDTDLALIKIDAKNLPIIPYGNSDELKLGQWVLAVGNPYNLTSTVTAGIVSAKARSIQILDPTGIESFIQTDAAVNPGNSGGALVNTKGELVGINTAIASRTGDYSGNSFAIPVSIVKKVVSDLMEYGTVQRAFIGVDIQDIDQAFAKEKKIDKIEGVYVAGVRDNGAAKAAGIKEGDIILSVNSVPVNTVAQLQEQVGRYRPNDKLTVNVRRDNNEKQFTVTLRNMSGSTSVVKQTETLSVLGASFEPVSAEDKKNLGIKNGVKITSLMAGKLMKAGVKEGYIITQVNNEPVKTVEDINDKILNRKGGIYLEGIYPDGTVAYYAFGM